MACAEPPLLEVVAAGETAKAHYSDDPLTPCFAPRTEGECAASRSRGSFQGCLRLAKLVGGKGLRRRAHGLL
jgi:hypothetical protein